MATIPTHALAGLVIADVVGGPQGGTGLRVAGALLAALPDADVLLMRYAHVAYADPWGHRGITHGVLFAVVVGAVAAAIFSRRTGLGWGRAATALVLATASHGVLDAMTTGGLGVAFLAPFRTERTFLPWTPIPVAPLSIRGFFTARGAEIAGWELTRLWVPLLALWGTVLVLRRRRREASAPSG